MRQEGKGLRWVKASERLPEKMKYFNGKLFGRPAIVCNTNLIEGFITANGNLERVGEVEWLDETPALPVVDGEGERKALERISKYEVDDGKLSRDMLYEVIDIATKALSEGQPE